MAELLEHLERHLGPVREFEEPTVLGFNRGFGLFFCYSPDGVVSVVTNGLRFQRVVSVFPQELVCSVRAGRREDAHLLVPLVAGIVLRRGYGLSLDEVVASADPEPVIPGTGIAGVVAGIHPYADEGFNSFDGRVQMITLVPATGRELDLARAAGVDELYEAWEDRNADLLDTRR